MLGKLWILIYPFLILISFPNSYFKVVSYKMAFILRVLSFKAETQTSPSVELEKPAFHVYLLGS